LNVVWPVLNIKVFDQVICLTTTITNQAVHNAHKMIVYIMCLTVVL